MAPFRDLLKKPTGKTVFWDGCLQQRLVKAKKVISHLAKRELTYFDKNCSTVAVTHWCKDDIGFVVMQQYCLCPPTRAPMCCKGGWRLTLCGSRHLAPAESGYAVAEEDTLAIAWCVRKARLFLIGVPSLVIMTDHRPLVRLFNDKTFADPGITIDPDEVDECQEDGVAATVTAATVAALDLSGCTTLDEDVVIQTALSGPEYQLLVSKVTNGDWCSHRSQETVCLRHFDLVKNI